MNTPTTLDPKDYYQEEYPSEYVNAYEESALSARANSYYRLQKANATSDIGFESMFEKSLDTGLQLDEEFQARPPWWVPIIIIVGLVVIILIVVAVAIYCGLRGTFEEPPATPKKRFDPNDDDARSEQCSSVRLEIRSESRATCGSSRAGCMSVGVNETTELQTLLVVPSNSQASMQPEPRKLDLGSLGVYDPTKSSITIPPPPPSPIAKCASSSAADTQTEDDEEESTSCSL